MRPSISIRVATFITIALAGTTTFGQDSSISYQGYLTDGGVITDPTNYQMVFRLYSQASGGTMLAAVGPLPVSVEDSLFSVALPFPQQVWTGIDRWLEVQVGGQTLSPRQKIRWVPHSVFATRAFEATQLAGECTPWDCIGADIVNSNTGNVGVGTGAATPLASLHIQTESLSLAAAALENDDLIVEADDAALGLYSAASGNWASAIALKEVEAGAIVDTWGIVRRPSTATNPSSLHFTYGTSDNYANNPSRMVISNLGNVGIGTTTPGFPLSFANTVGDKIALFGQSGNHYGLGIENNLLQIHSNGSGADIAFGYGNSAAMTETVRFKGTGNVGIGTATPAQKLSVAGIVQSTTGGFMFPDGTTQITAAGAGGFWTASGANIFSNNTGNVGVGTNAPASKFHVKSDAAGQTGIRIDNLSTSSSATAGVLFRTGGTGQPAAVAMIELRNPTLGDYGLEIDAGTGDIFLNTAGRIEARGISPNGARLHLFDGGDQRTVELTGGTNAGGGELSLYESAGSVATIVGEAIGSGGTGGGQITLKTIGGTATAYLYAADATNQGAAIDLKRGNGSNGVYLNAEETAGGGAALSLYAPGNLETIKLDADYQGTGVGRVITDVLEITGADLAEKFPTSEDIAAGMVVAIDVENEGKLCLARGAYNRTVAGVVSGANGFSVGAILGSRAESEDGPPIALAGRVYVWVDADVAPIKPGDLLTSAETPGHAMKVLDHTAAQGAILGKAMGSLDKGRGLVLVLVNLQ